MEPEVPAEIIIGITYAATAEIPTKIPAEISSDISSKFPAECPQGLLYNFFLEFTK